MNYKNVFSAVMAMLLILSVSVFANDAPEKFSPVGTWEYSVPYAPDGYQAGTMIIAEKEDGYSVSMVLNEYSKAEGEKVEYDNKSIKFSVWVEGEEVRISGEFDGDSFTGKVDYSGGITLAFSHLNKSFYGSLSPRECAWLSALF